MVDLIKDEIQYKKYLNEMTHLIDKNPEVGTPDDERIILLSMAIEKYENNRFFFSKPTAIEAIRFRMEEMDLSQNDLIPYIGSKSKVSEILSGKRNLSMSMVRTLNEHLKIPVEILIQNPSINKSQFDEEVDYAKFPVEELIKRGWIDSASDKILGNKSLPQQATMFRKSIHKTKSSKEDDYATMAWLLRSNYLADLINVSAYDKKNITTSFLNDVAKLSKFDLGPLLAIEMLSKHGIKLIFLRALPKMKVDGACFLDSAGSPVICMTIRHDRVDNFWFTLLHELAHVYKHLSTDANVYVDDVESHEGKSHIEKQADQIASDACIPRIIWKRSEAFINPTTENIVQLASSLSIDPAIIAGRIRYEKNDFTIFNDLLGQNTVRTILKKVIND